MQRHTEAILAILVIFVAIVFQMTASKEFYITGLRVIEGGQPAPNGFEVIPSDLNEGTDIPGKVLYFAVRNGTNRNEAIKDIVVVHGTKKNVPVPSGYEKLVKDLNSGSNGEFVFAAISRDAAKGNPIVKIAVLTCDNDNQECQCLDANMYKIPQDLNKDAGGKFIFLCFRRGA